MNLINVKHEFNIIVQPVGVLQYMMIKYFSSHYQALPLINDNSNIEGSTTVQCTCTCTRIYEPNVCAIHMPVRWSI